VRIYLPLFAATLLLAFLLRWSIRRRRRSTSTLPRVALLATAILAGLLAILSTGAGAYMVWYAHRAQPAPERRPLFVGIDYARHVRQSPRPMVVHAMTIDLRAPGVSFLVTPARPTDGRVVRAQKTSAFLEEFNCQAAVNGNYFYPFKSSSPLDYFPHAGDGVSLSGFAASRGAVYSDKQWMPGVLYLSEDNQASFDAPIGPVYNAIAGNGFLVADGKPVAPPPADDVPYPRAAVGLSADRRYLTFVIIDGKQPGYSEGATLTELSHVLIELGVHTAARLDEGGSCAMAVEERPGKAKLLNVPINHRIPYVERVVANHLGIYARRLPAR